MTEAPVAPTKTTVFGAATRRAPGNRNLPGAPLCGKDGGWEYLPRQHPKRTGGHLAVTCVTGRKDIPASSEWLHTRDTTREPRTPFVCSRLLIL